MRDQIHHLLLQALASTKHEFNLNPGTKDSKLISERIDFLTAFGEPAIAALKAYLYIHPTVFFDWSQIITLLKENLAKTLPDTDAAWATYSAIRVEYPFYRPPKILPELTAKFVNENGGWVKLCSMEVDKLEKLFYKKYPMLIDEYVLGEMEKHVK